MYEVPRIVKFIESESAVVDARGQWGRVVRSRNGELVFNGDRVSVWEGEKCRRWMMVRIAQQCKCASATEVYS